jgi:hypothetical protein
MRQPSRDADTQFDDRLLGNTNRLKGVAMSGFRELLSVQRWYDHRYYHHSRINQSLHLPSAMSFVYAYILAFRDPAAAALTGWLVSMASRQVGHFFFEPKGYNLRREVILMTIWAFLPLILFADPTLLHTVEPHKTFAEFMRHVGYLWLALGVGGLLFRTLHLFKIKDVQTGLVWATKIITDPFHDIKLYYRAPKHLFRGELIDTAPPELFPGHPSGSMGFR